MKKHIFYDKIKVVIDYSNEVMILMYEKLKEVCEEILSDETKTKEFLLVSSIEEMYNFFKGKIPNLSTSEFDDFIAELLENYERMQLEGTTIDDEMLQNVSGGAKFGSKITAASLALLMGVSAGGAPASATDGTNKFSAAVKNVGRKVSNTSSSYGKWWADTLRKHGFAKTADWFEQHTGFVSIASVVMAILAIAGLTYGGFKVKQRYFPGAQTPSEYIKSIIPKLMKGLPEKVYKSVEKLIDAGKYDEAAAVLDKTPFEDLDDDQQLTLIDCASYLRYLWRLSQSSETLIAVRVNEDDAVVYEEGESKDNRVDEKDKKEKKEKEKKEKEKKEKEKKEKEKKEEEPKGGAGRDVKVGEKPVAEMTEEERKREEERKEAEAKTYAKAKGICSKMPSVTARVSMRNRLEGKVASGEDLSPKEMAMLKILTDQKEDDDIELKELVERKWKKLTKDDKRRLKRIERPSLLDRLLLEKLENSSEKSKPHHKTRSQAW